MGIAVAHTVSDSSHSAHEPRLGRVILELASQVANVDIDEVFVSDPGSAPHNLDELLAAECHPRAFRKRGQWIELGAGEFGRSLRNICLAITVATTLFVALPVCGR